MSNDSATLSLLSVLILIVQVGLFPSFCQAQEQDEISAIVFDIRDGRILAAQSERDLMIARPVGSLAKPLVAYALLASGKRSDDVFNCRTSKPDEASTQTCWYKPGHGNLTFVPALAQSCNSWFRHWLNEGSGEAAIELFQRNDIVSDVDFTSYGQPVLTLCGLEGNLPMQGLNCAATFATLFNGGIVFSTHQTKTGIAFSPVATISVDAEAADLVAAGMRECGTIGTGAAFGKAFTAGSALVKTGTAYAHTSAGIDETKTDGWCIALYPAERPLHLVLLRLPGGSGAQAAAEAAEFLRMALDEE